MDSELLLGKHHSMIRITLLTASMTAKFQFIIVNSLNFPYHLFPLVAICAIMLYPKGLLFDVVNVDVVCMLCVYCQLKRSSGKEL